MAATYVEVGGIKSLSVLVYDSSNALADPTSVSVAVTLPDGTSAGTFTPTKASVGNYYYDYATVQVGNHTARWVGVGTNAFTWSDEFYVNPTWAGLVGIGDAKAYVNVTTSTDETEIRSFVIAATAAVQSYTQQTFAATAATRTYNGFELVDALVLPSDTTAVATVTENGRTLAATEYAFDSTTSILYRRTSTYYTMPWLRGSQNITVTLTRGSTTVPADVRHACLIVVKHLWETQRGGMAPILNAGSDDWNPTATYSIPRRAQELLDPYRVPAFR